MASARQISPILASDSRPIRSTRTAIDTLSTESRLTADGSGTGSSPGSSLTSLIRPRIVVVHGATRARRCRGMTASRDSTTTGLRPMFRGSHHHTSPRAGSGLTCVPQLPGMTQDRPMRLPDQAAHHRKLRSSRRSGLLDAVRVGPATPLLSFRNLSCLTVTPGRCPATLRRPWCLFVLSSCHDYATASLYCPRPLVTHDAHASPTDTVTCDGCQVKLPQLVTCSSVVGRLQAD